jgi:hypothetical protein
VLLEVRVLAGFALEERHGLLDVHVVARCGSPKQAAERVRLATALLVVRRG